MDSSCDFRLFADSDDARVMRQKIKTILSSLLALFRGISNRKKQRKDCADPLEIVWDSVKVVLPNTTAMSVMLGIVAMPDFRNSLPEQYRPIFMRNSVICELIGRPKGLNGFFVVLWALLCFTLRIATSVIDHEMSFLLLQCVFVRVSVCLW